MESIKVPATRGEALLLAETVMYESRAATISDTADLLLALVAASRKQAQAGYDFTMEELSEAKREIRSLRQAQEPLVEALRDALAAFNSLLPDDSLGSVYFADGSGYPIICELRDKCARALKSAEQSSSVETGK